MELPPRLVDLAGIRTLFPTAVHEQNGRINHLNYSEDGNLLITSDDNDCMTVYDIQTGTLNRTINSKKYGVNLVHFVRGTKDVISASTKVDNTIRYLSLSNNQYLRYFVGHSKKVVTLCMNPTEEMFLSGALDNTVRLWDLRVSTCQGVMNLPSRPIVAFDPDGLIFAAGINSETIKLYDLKTFDKGPFATFNVKPDDEFNFEWTNMTFSPDGQTILISTNGEMLRVVNSFTGKLQATLIGHENKEKLSLNGCFSPDSKFVFCGGSDGQLTAWDRDTGEVVQQYKTNDNDSIEQCLFNHKYYILATGSKKLSLWNPE
ncbi:unnamed protein product [Bursaphelenchus okinawaensis]|uniref:WD_REPEATS_REGION domain-containing protein n=1 Tax=Bursaphelenchus okinawaensis TaxID=465554 RepID=A0A811KLF3_9BILA|nr:unnamed protein product [Bursaphelenchus okinawaensis]CAG9106174.1 unnamed protein product [Bursaphelenchus okinawaensis]